MPPLFPPRAAPLKTIHHCCHHFQQLRQFRTTCRLGSDLTRKNHYERLNVRTDATPADIKKSFYSLSKTHHPDANRSDPNASETFSLISESYTILSDSSRRAVYDRDVLHLNQFAPANQRKGSYHSTSNPAGGRPASGLSRRRGTFRGPPPSFYRSGGWGAQSEKRRKAHEDSTTAGPEKSPFGGMGPGSDPFGHHEEVPHFDKQGHKKTHETEDQRRWQRQKRAVDEDGIEFEPQTSVGAHFLIVASILGVTFLAPLVYLQFVRGERRKKEYARLT